MAIFSIAMFVYQRVSLCPNKWQANLNVQQRLWHCRRSLSKQWRHAVGHRALAGNDA